MRLSDLLAGVALCACACATVDRFQANRESAIAHARADLGCAEPMTAEIADSMEAGFGGNRVGAAEVVVTGCGEVRRYQTICGKGSYASGCETNAMGPPDRAPN